MLRWLMRDRRAFIRGLLSMPAAGALAASDLNAASKKKLPHSARDVIGETGSQDVFSMPPAPTRGSPPQRCLPRSKVRC